MADQNKILIEIQLDDGSIRKGFAVFKDEAARAAKESSKEFKNFGDVIDSKPLDKIKESIRALPVELGFVAAGAAAAGVAINKAFDLTLAGEQIKTIENSFKSLAENAGLNATALQGGLEQSAQGLADTTDLLNSANRAIGALGENAKELPRLLDLARKSSTAFGGEITQNFESINQAIVTGNSRALRQVGIFVDLDQAVKNYAKNVNLSVESLTDQEKQQARVNAVLEAGQKSLGGIDESSRQATNSFLAFKNALKDIEDAAAVATSNVFGGAFAGIFNKLGQSAKNLSDTFKAQEQSAAGAEAQTRLYENELKRIETTLGQIGQSDPLRDRYEKRAEALRDLINVQKQESLLQRDPAEDPNQRERLFAEQDAKLTDLRKRQAVERKKEDEKTLAERVAYDQALTTIQAQGEQARYDLLAANNKNEELLNIQEAQKATALAFEKKQALLNIEKQFENSEVISDTEKKALAEAQDKLFLDRSLALRAEYEKKRADLIQKTGDGIKKYEDRTNKEKLQGISETLGQIATLQESSSKELVAVGRAAALTKATIDAYGSINNAYNSVPYPFNIAAAALVGVAAFANVQKIASSGGGGGSADKFDTTVGGGGISLVPSDVTTPTASELETRQPSTEVVVNIHGDVLDSDDSGVRIVDLIQSAFDKQGVKIRREVVA